MRKREEKGRKKNLDHVDGRLLHGLGSHALQVDHGADLEGGVSPLSLRFCEQSVQVLCHSHPVILDQIGHRRQVDQGLHTGLSRLLVHDRTVLAVEGVVGVGVERLVKAEKKGGQRSEERKKEG